MLVVVESQTRVPADAGWLAGPDSVSWQLHADPAMWFGGIRSLYLQALHPRVVAGVIQNSDFRTDPFGRLFRTADFIGVSTYGSAQEAAEIGARIRGIHRSLRLTDPDTGATHRVDEPDLLLWVHCAEVASFAEVAHRAGFPMTRRHEDAYFTEQKATAALVGLHPQDVPGTATEMRDYFRSMRPVLRGGTDAEEIYRFLHRPPVDRRLRTALPIYESLVGHLAFALLPGWAQRAYGHRGYPAPVATAMLRTFRRSALLAPVNTPFLGRGPHIQAAIATHGNAVTPGSHKLFR